MKRYFSTKFIILDWQDNTTNSSLVERNVPDLLVEAVLQEMGQIQRVLYFQESAMSHFLSVSVSIDRNLI